MVNYTNILWADSSTEDLRYFLSCTVKIVCYFFVAETVINFTNILHQNAFAKQLQSQIVSREKQRTRLLNIKLIVKCWWNWYLGPISSNFINTLCKAITRADPKSAKKNDKLTVFSALLRSAWTCKSCSYNVHALTPGLNFTNIFTYSF